jgi:hypothetical protein
MPIIENKRNPEEFEKRVQWLEDIQTKLKKSNVLTTDLINEIAEEISRGAWLEVVCKSLGVRSDLLYEWLQIGSGRHPTKEPTPLTQALYHKIQAAEAIKEMNATQTLLSIAEGSIVANEKTITKKNGDVVVEKTYNRPNGYAIQFFLERRYPQRWSRIQYIDTTAPLKDKSDKEIDENIIDLIPLQIK